MCECANKANETLVKEKGCRLAVITNPVTGQTKPALHIEPIAGKKKPKLVIIPAYCPFCGEKYERV